MPVIFIELTRSVLAIRVKDRDSSKMDVDLEYKREPSPSDSSPSREEHGKISNAPKGPLFTRIIDSFRENPNARVSPLVLDEEGKPLPNQPPAQPALAHKLKERHLQMIAIGGSIGK